MHALGDQIGQAAAAAGVLEAETAAAAKAAWIAAQPARIAAAATHNGLVLFDKLMAVRTTVKFCASSSTTCRCRASARRSR